MRPQRSGCTLSILSSATNQAKLRQPDAMYPGVSPLCTSPLARQSSRMPFSSKQQPLFCVTDRAIPIVAVVPRSRSALWIHLKLAFSDQGRQRGAESLSAVENTKRILLPQTQGVPNPRIILLGSILAFRDGVPCPVGAKQSGLQH